MNHHVYLGKGNLVGVNEMKGNLQALWSTLLLICTCNYSELTS